MMPSTSWRKIPGAWAEKMAGFQNRYRFRVGDYRIVYEIHDAVLLVLILAVGDRKEIYR
jgi:mRNA interferase RelE/StbE